MAQDYLQLRITDLLVDLYARTTTAYARSLKLTQSQYAVGVALRSDVALAESQLKTAEAQAIDLQAQRSQIEHAIAILIGKAPSQFFLAALCPPIHRCSPRCKPACSQSLQACLPICWNAGPTSPISVSPRRPISRH